jgi:hypothetical protein
MKIWITDTSLGTAKKIASSPLTGIRQMIAPIHPPS